MKFLLITLVALLSCNSNYAQPKDPITWKYEFKKKTATTYDLIVTATLPKPWHIYSQNTGDGGPIPTKITFSKNPLVVNEGKVVELGKLEKSYDQNFKTNVLSYANKVSFVQAIKLKVPVKTRINGTVEYMVCNDEMCLPPTKKLFFINIQ